MSAEYLILIPTYDEVENVERIFNKISKVMGKTADILFVDDNSTDGTKLILKDLSDKHAHVHVINRPYKMGIGSAHKDGIDWAYKQKYKVLISMDCDLTHSPSDIPVFIEKSSGVNIVVGSRYIHKGSIEAWSIYRKFMTKLGHLLTRTLLGLKYDASGAFRLYKLSDIDQNVFNLIESKAYSFFFESLLILHLNKYTIKEFPIDLPVRTYGSSKMTTADIFLSVKMLWKLFLRKTLSRKKMLL